MILTNFKVFLNCLCWSLFAFGLRILWCFAPLRPLNKPSKCICVIKCIIFLLSSFFLSICSLYYFSSLILVFRDYWFVLIFISFWSLCSLVFFYYEISKSNYSLVSLSMLLTRSQLPLYDLYVCVCVCLCVCVCEERFWASNSKKEIRKDR